MRPGRILPPTLLCRGGRRHGASEGAQQSAPAWEHPKVPVLVVMEHSAEAWSAPSTVECVVAIRALLEDHVSAKARHMQPLAKYYFDGKVIAVFTSSC